MSATGLELLERLHQWAHDSEPRIAYVETHDGRSLSYEELHRRVSNLASQLSTEIQQGDVVMLCIGNRIEFPIWYLALLACSASVFPVSTKLTQSEIRVLADRSGAKSVITAESTIPQSTQADVMRQSCGAVGDMLLASSGTTGAPKVVRRNAASLDAVARNMVDAIGFRSDDRVLAWVPLTHSYGVEHGLLAPLWAGSSVQLIDGSDMTAISRQLGGNGDFTIFPAVPSMIEMLAGLGDLSVAMPRLRLVYSAGAPLPLEVGQRFERRFGLRIGQLYGMSEIGSVTFNSPLSDHFDASSVGQPMRDVSIRVLDFDASRTKLPPGCDGEIVVRAPSMLSQYIGDDTPLLDGHFPTGDVGHLDDRGDLTITGRVRLLIDTGGIKVNPIEIESVIAMHPEVTECVVIPVRQSQTVQRLCAVIVPRDRRMPPSSDAIRRFARERLAAYKVPRVICCRDELPRTASGKVIRHLLEVT